MLTALHRYTRPLRHRNPGAPKHPVYSTVTRLQGRADSLEAAREIHGQGRPADEERGLADYVNVGRSGQGEISQGYVE